MNANGSDFQEAHWRAFSGLLNGDLTGLRDFIRSGHAIDLELATQIADTIDGNFAGFRIEIRGQGKGHKGWLVRIRAEEKKIRIALFVERRKARADRGQHDSIIAEAASYFDIKRPTVEAAWTWWKKVEAGQEKLSAGCCVQTIEEEYPNE